MKSPRPEISLDDQDTILELLCKYGYAPSFCTSLTPLVRQRPC